MIVVSIIFLIFALEISYLLFLMFLCFILNVLIMEKVISNEERSSLLEDTHDFFKVIVTYRVGSQVRTSRLAVRVDNVSAFMDCVYDTYTNDAVIQFNGIFSQRDPRFWFLMV